LRTPSTGRRCWTAGRTYGGSSSTPKTPSPRHPFGLPFSLRNERLKRYLNYLRVTPEELYRLFAVRVDHDLVAREYLGMSAEDVAVVTTALPDESVVKTAYGLDTGDLLTDLQDVERFSAATGLAGDQVRELVSVSPDLVMGSDGTRIEPRAGAGAVGVGWFESANRFLRLARLTGMTLTDLSLVLTSCCAGRIDADAVRTVAVVLGVLRADGTLAVESTAGLRLATDFNGYAEMLFKAISSVVNGAASFFPSDLVGLDTLTQEQQAELYDNLVFNGYLDEEGDLRQPDLFADADNVALFAVNADLSDVTEPVRQLLDDRIAKFRSEPLPLDPEIFADLRLTEAQLAALADSLRFNGYLDDSGAYRDKAALNTLPLADFRLALQFYPNRKAILEAVRGQIAAFKAELYTFNPDDFVPLADNAMSERVLDALDGTYTGDGRVLDETVFADPDGWLDLGPGFTDVEQQTVYRRIATVLADQEPYRLGSPAVIDLGFTDDEREQLCTQLIDLGVLDEGRAVTPACCRTSVPSPTRWTSSCPGWRTTAPTSSSCCTRWRPRSTRPSPRSANAWPTRRGCSRTPSTAGSPTRSAYRPRPWRRSVKR
jgi:hypothetical protein